MVMLDYIVGALGAWLIAFLPLTGIYIAVPAAVAAGLDNLSVVIWAVFGNYMPIVVIHWLYERLMRIERVRILLRRLVSQQIKVQIDRWGLWFVLLLTPLAGVWLVAITVKSLGMESRRFLLASFVSILGYAIVILIALRFGISAVVG